MTQKSDSPQNRICSISNPPKSQEHACLNFDMCPPFTLYGLLVSIFLPSLGLSLIFTGLLRQNHSYKPVFGFLAPCSESVLFSRNRPVSAGITWTVSGSHRISIGMYLKHNSPSLFGNSLRQQ